METAVKCDRPTRTRARPRVRAGFQFLIKAAVVCDRPTKRKNMTFTVTYRAKDGAMREERIEAASRAECVAECRKRGIAPTGIKEGKGRDGARSSRVAARGDVRPPDEKNSKRTTTRWVAAAAVIAALIGGGVWWWLGREKPQPAPVVKPTKVKVEKPLPRKPAAKPAAPVETPKPKEEPAPKPVVTNFVNNVWRDEKGRPHYKVARVIRPGQNTVINGKPWKPERPVFHHPSEVELDVLLSRKPGERIFGEVNWKAFERDLPMALADKIEILPDDTPDEVARKQIVMEAKKELLEAIKAGENPMEILKSSRDEVNRLADVRDNLLSKVAELKQEGASEEEIEDAVKAANMMLKEYNIDKPILSPKTMRERAAAAKQRKLQKQQNGE